jgi:hypothetical protein
MKETFIACLSIQLAGRSFRVFGHAIRLSVLKLKLRPSGCVIGRS